MLSGSAVVLHLLRITGAPSRFHLWALVVIAGGFPILIGIAVAAEADCIGGRSGFAEQLIALGALFYLFYLSFTSDTGTRLRPGRRR